MRHRAGGRPFKKGRKKTGGRKKGTLNKATASIREFFQTLSTAVDYQRSLRRRILKGMAPSPELYGLQLIGGKPKETVETPGLESLAAAMREGIEQGKRAMAAEAAKLAAAAVTAKA